MFTLPKKTSHINTYINIFQRTAMANVFGPCTTNLLEEVLVQKIPKKFLASPHPLL